MIPRLLALARAESRLIGRLEKLQTSLDDGDPAGWQEYAALATALAAVTTQVRPELLAEVVSQKELAARMGVSPRTIRRRAAVQRGQVPPKRRAIVKAP